MLVPRRLLGAAIALVLTSGWLLALPERAYADSAISPKSGNFTVRGSGFGHGWGMSQYGAYGAARQRAELGADPRASTTPAPSSRTWPAAPRCGSG